MTLPLILLSAVLLLLLLLLLLLRCCVHLQLVEALNEDYSDYVGLSGQLSGLEGAVVRMRQPLLEIQVRQQVKAQQCAYRGRSMLGACTKGLRILVWTAQQIC